MEVGVRLIGVWLRLMKLLIDVLTAPFLWMRGRRRRVCPPDHDPVLQYSGIELAAKIRGGDLTSEAVVTTYINRVKTVNPLLNAVVDERFKLALEEARSVDRVLVEARRSGDWDQLQGKPLLGVPFTVKESCSLEGMSNSVGCLENAGRKATHDGEAVKRVRAAGAIPLLVSNTPELCLGWETTNLLNGTTNNPYSLDRTPGGSSGGEGALLASGASPFGVASDIAGSIRLPAAYCGVFGHKPTPGIIPIEGHIPSLADEKFSQFLTVGPMARRADDLPLLMRIMAGEKADQLRLDDPVDFTQLKVYYMTESTISVSLLDTHHAIKQMVVEAAKYLERECGASISDKKFKGLEDSVEISISEFFSMKDIPNMLADPSNPKRDKSMLVELTKHIFGGATRSLQGLGFTLIKRHQLFISKRRQAYYRGRAADLKGELVRSLSSDGVLLYPVFSSSAHRHRGVFTRASGVMYTMLFNILGLPALAVPMTTRGGLPLAIQVIAAPNQDRLCLAVGKKLEEAFGGWQPVPTPV